MNLGKTVRLSTQVHLLITPVVLCVGLAISRPPAVARIQRKGAEAQRQINLSFVFAPLRLCIETTWERASSDRDGRSSVAGLNGLKAADDKLLYELTSTAVA